MHIPVFKKEVLKFLDVKPNKNFIDCTVGEGGHSFAIIKYILPEGKILAIDRTPRLIQKLKEKIANSELKNNFIFRTDNFVNLEEIVEEEKIKPISGILFDLGMSSWHLEKSGKGFTFLKDEPLIMRYDDQNDIKNKKLTARQIINTWPPEEIEKILQQYSQEDFASKITKEIVKQRKIKPILTTFELVEVIKNSVPWWYKRKKIHYATKTFQALRIATNNELSNLEKALKAALKVLDRKGRLVVISFHSGEDRIVKFFFKEKEADNSLEILTKKPIKVSLSEVKANPRARSAKLRVAVKKV